MKHYRYKQLSFCLVAWLWLCFLGQGLAYASVTVMPKAIASRVKAYILASTPSPKEQNATVDVEVLNLPQLPVQLEGENLKWVLSDTRPTPLTPSTIVQVSLSTESDLRHIGIPVRIYIDRPVWVVKQLIMAHQPITPSDVTLERKRLTYEAPYVIGEKDNITAYSAQSNLAPGTILQSRQLFLTPAIFRNDQIRLVLVMASGVQVSVMARALEDGAIGKRIRVQEQLANNQYKVLTGQVVSHDTVVIRL